MRCYERLDSLDPRGRKFGAEPIDVVSMRAFIEECSRKALDVSLQSQNLSNLQRGRLLDSTARVALALRQAEYIGRQVKARSV
jgi:hypothetical protein